MEIGVLILHLLVDLIMGLCAFRLINHNHIRTVDLSIALVIGMILSTLSIWGLNLLGLSIGLGFWLVALTAILISLILHFQKTRSIVWDVSLKIKRPSLWELVLTIFIFEKVVWCLYSLIKLPVYFDDALRHWSGRGKALLFENNWSWNPESIYFMGRAIGDEELPLFASIWRAINASILGYNNVGLEKIDGFILFLILMLFTCHKVTQLTGKRWLGLLTVAVIAGLPLEMWHVTSGYVDIYLQVLFVLALWALWDKKYVIAGILTAGLIWSSNDGLLIYTTALFVATFACSFIDSSTSVNDKISAVIRFNATWLLLVLPWVLFKLVNGVDLLSSSIQDLGYNEGGIKLFFSSLFNSPSSSIIWIVVFVAIGISLNKILSNRKLTYWMCSCFVGLLMMAFMYMCTGAFKFLENESSIHRSLLQIAPAFIILAILALSDLKENSEPNQAV